MTDFKNTLTDLIRTTNGLDFEVIKVIATDSETKFLATRENFVMNAKTKTPCSEIEGTFGLINLNVLKGYVDIYNSYADNVEVNMKLNKITKNGNVVPSDISFEAKGQSTAVHRLAAESAIPKVAVMQNIKWTTEMQNPAKIKIKEFESFARVLNNKEKKFSVSVKNKKLLFSIGNADQSSNSVVIDMGEVSVDIMRGNVYPIPEFLNLINNSNITLKFADKGLLEVMVDTGLIDYHFLIMSNINDS